MTRLVYPQLGTGALSQFPIRKSRRTRTVMNRAADGSTIKLADPAGVVTEWSLTYADLSDQEAGALQAFFEAAEGSLSAFTFLDPAGNLLAWSEQFDNDVWQRDPFLQVTAGVDDPRGGTGASAIANSGGAGQTLPQTIAAPGGLQYCFSVYVRAASSTSVRLWAGSESREFTVSLPWERLEMPAADADATSLRCGIEVAGAASIQVYGMQAEAQPGASGYKPTSQGGVYEGAHLRDDSLAITKTGVNRHSCTVNIIHAKHL
ncbi:MAG: hypothetical protein JWP63_2974 [Candidatus Solibacter sp.]|nr:hypothetical protein [Candidatus Solibacter sp.]